MVKQATTPSSRCRIKALLVPKPCAEFPNEAPWANRELSFKPSKIRSPIATPTMPVIMVNKITSSTDPPIFEVSSMAKGVEIERAIKL